MTPPDVSALSLAEKVALLSGRDFWSTQPVGDVPSVVLTDGPHGVRLAAAGPGSPASPPATCFPLAVAVGSSWDAEVARQVGEAVGREARALGVGVVLGPGVNIKRSPLCGRNFEYYSEDPLLSGVLGAAHVRGLQAQGVGASVKHFAANNQETDRMQVSADVDERTLREVYLPAFERVVTDAAPATVMAAYNRVNGVPASANRWLLTDVLREEWGFTGAVVSDWGAVSDPVASLRAGLDLQMPGTSGRSTQLVLDAVADGSLDADVVDTAAARVLALTAPAGDPTDPVDLPAQHALARRLATGCAVLLTNDGTLPLAPGTRVAVVGEFARTPRYQGGGSSHVGAGQVDAPLDAMRALADGEVTFSPGFSLDGTGSAEDLVADAVAAARAADVAVVFAGLADADESEGFDRTTLELPAAQVALIRAVAAAAPRTVVVLTHGGVVSLEGWHDEVHAVLTGALLGQGGGRALADLLHGVANPSGRLAETVPVALADTASFVNFPGEQGHVRYGEGVLVGYRWHTATGRVPRYPFGHGLSYTSFAVTDLDVQVTGEDTAQVTVTVTNTGDRAGAHVVQVYVGTDAGPVRRPVRELRGFTKIHLDPGQARTVTLQLDRRAFAYWDVVESGWVVAPGTYAVQVCQDAETVVLEQAVTLAGDVVVHELTMDSTVEEWSTHPVVGPLLLTDLLVDLPTDRGIPEVTPQLLLMVGSMPMRKVADMLGDAVPVSAFEALAARSRVAQP